MRPIPLIAVLMLVLTATGAAPLPPEEASRQVGKRATVEFVVQSTGSNPAGFLELYSSKSWDDPGCFFIRFPDSIGNTFRHLGIRSLDRHFGGRRVRATGVVEQLKFNGKPHGCIVVSDLGNLEVLPRLYEAKNIEGFVVRISPELDVHPRDRSDALKELSKQLAQINEVVPAGAMKRLREIPIRLEWNVKEHAAFYTWDSPVGWNNDDPENVNAVVIANARLFVEWSQSGQPWMVLHELAHGYQRLALGGDSCKPITDAYRNAIDKGLYESVPYRDGKKQKAYATGDAREYFSELSEAYFGRNDYFPFSRDDLKKHDPLGFALMQAMWEPDMPESPLPLPTPQQVAWQNLETTMFLHFGPNTFLGNEWGKGTEDPKVFNPTKLDARQWARAAKAGGFKLMILTAKHHDGFCLWPSKFTEHSVKNSPWKDGRGDVVREFVDAARAEGLKVGLYLSPWDRHEPSYGDSDKYNQFYKNQLTELMTQYGEMTEVWFDGACGEGPNGKRQVYDWPGFIEVIRKHQLGAVIFSDAGPDIRWIGNEQGFADDPNWSTVDPSIVPVPGMSGDKVMQSLHHGDRSGTVWRPGECDVSIRPGWFWKESEDDKVRSVDNLIDLYFRSVGRNSLLLLNVPPTSEGLLHETDVARLKEFRQRVDAIFATDLAATAERSDTTNGTRIELKFEAPVTFDVLMLAEDITQGQRVAKFHVDYVDGNSWKPLLAGQTIGHKRLDRFKSVTTTQLRLLVDESIGLPVISGLCLFKSP